MKISIEKKCTKQSCITKLLMSFCLMVFLCSCAVVEVKEPAAQQSTTAQADPKESAATQTTTTEPPVVERKTDSDHSEATAFLGVVIATAVTIWAVTEYIEEKVVPAVLGLTVAYLLYQASRNSESEEMN